MELKFILEAILFSAQHPLSTKELRSVLADAVEHSEEALVRTLKKTTLEAIQATLEELAREHEQAQRSYRLLCVAEAWQFASQPEYAPWIKALVGHKARPPRLSAPALETLAIIAYRQPVTRAEIEQVRGVAVDGVMQTLLDRGFVEQVGRAEVVGRPLTYGTTAGFLEYFGVRSLDELPAADELRRAVVAKPEGLLTADPGLATTPPDELALSEPSAEAPAPPAEPAPTAEAPTARTESTESAQPAEASALIPAKGPRNRLKSKPAPPLPETNADN